MAMRRILLGMLALFLLHSPLASCAQSSDSSCNSTQHTTLTSSVISGGNLWVVLVATSRNWLNYRDNSNTIALYRIFRRLGVPDSNIILMLGHSMACDPRNPHPGQLFVNPDHAWDLYKEPIEVDYRGADVTVESFLRVLTGFHFPGTPLSKQLRSDANSHILMYLTGHGGDKFLKFQDKEELQANDLADALHLMHLQKRYRSVLLMTDTCQADSLHSQLRSPNILAIASSAKGENSYSYLQDADLGVSVVDRFTFTTLRFLENAIAASDRSFDPNHPLEDTAYAPVAASLERLFAAYDRGFLESTPCLRTENFPTPLSQVPTLRYFQWTAPIRKEQLSSVCKTQKGMSSRSSMEEERNAMKKEGMLLRSSMDEDYAYWASDYLRQTEVDALASYDWLEQDGVNPEESTVPQSNDGLIAVTLFAWLSILGVASFAFL